MIHEVKIDGLLWRPGDIAVGPDGTLWLAQGCITASGENSVLFKELKMDVMGVYLPPGPLRRYDNCQAHPVELRP